MKVTIIGRNEQRTLEIIDPTNGNEWTADFIGNHGGFSDGQFTVDVHGDIACTEATYGWWYDVIAQFNHLECIIDAYVNQFDVATVLGVVFGASDCDLEDQPASVIHALHEQFGVIDHA